MTQSWIIYGASTEYRTHGAVKSFQTFRYHNGGTAQIILNAFTNGTTGQGNDLRPHARLLRLGFRRQTDGAQVAVCEWAGTPLPLGGRSVGMNPGWYALNMRWEASTIPPWSTGGSFRASLVFQ